MSTRPTFRPAQVITADDMLDDVTSLVTILGSMTRFSYQAVWSASTAVGTIAVQVSNTYALGANGVVSVAGSWTPITVQYGGTAVSTVPVTGASGTAFIDVQTAGAAVRLVYTATSGGGTLSAYIDAKVS